MHTCILVNKIKWFRQFKLLPVNISWTLMNLQNIKWQQIISLWTREFNWHLLVLISYTIYIHTQHSTNIYGLYVLFVHACHKWHGQNLCTLRISSICSWLWSWVDPQPICKIQWVCWSQIIRYQHNQLIVLVYYHGICLNKPLVIDICPIC